MNKIKKILQAITSSTILISGICQIFFRKAALKDLGVKEIDLSKVPPKTLIKKLISKVKIRYPNLYKVLIEERNKVMANNLSALIKKNPDKNILAIVGAGHEDELVSLIKSNFQ